MDADIFLTLCPPEAILPLSLPVQVCLSSRLDRFGLGVPGIGGTDPFLVLFGGGRPVWIPDPCDGGSF